MTRLIDTNELIKWVKNWTKMDHYYHSGEKRNDIPISELGDIIDRMPTIDAVPVIRCKDCKYYIWEIDTCNEQHSTVHNIVHENDYCSRAERRRMTNGDKFKSIFGIYATELWAKSEENFLEWMNSETEEQEKTNETD